MASNGVYAFQYQGGPTWMNAKSDFLSSEYFYIDPIKKIDESTNAVEFELFSDKWWLVGGPGCAIVIEGAFVMAAAATPTKYDLCREEEIERVMVCPNWIGQLIKEETIFDGNTAIKIHSEAPGVAPFLDTYLMAHMHKDDRKFFCPDAHHPANGVPTKCDKGWKQEADSQWRSYAATIFDGKAIRFNYKPLHNFLFFQGCNEFIDGQVSNALPLPALGKLTYRIIFHDHSRIFNRKANNTDLYRFRFDSVRLVMTAAKLSPHFDKQLSSKRMRMAFRGVTRNMIAENVTFGVTTHMCRFQNIYMPEEILIFTVSKTVVNGTWKYQNDTLENGRVFGLHDIKEVHLAFNNQPFYYKSPNFGQILEPVMVQKTYQDFMLNPPLGMLQDADMIRIEDVATQGANTPYPLVYIPLVNADKSRFRTVKGDSIILAERGDLEVKIVFKTGAVKDVTYIVMANQKDFNVVFEKSKFQSVYLAN